MNMTLQAALGVTMAKLGIALKIGSFLVGLVILLWAALFLDYLDWDVGISLTMAFATLATAEWSTSIVWRMQWKWLPLAAFWCWLSVDGVYWAYRSLVNPNAMIREGQWLASLCLYSLCGVIWYRLVPIAAEWIDSRISDSIRPNGGPEQ